MPRVIYLILLVFLLIGGTVPLQAAPIGFQGNPIQFPYATAPRGIGFQGQYYNPNRLVVDPDLVGPGFHPTRGTFPLQQDPPSRFFDPRLSDPPVDFPSQRGF
jgi:hypothetical protein